MVRDKVGAVVFAAAVLYQPNTVLFCKVLSMVFPAEISLPCFAPTRQTLFALQSHGNRKQIVRQVRCAGGGCVYRNSVAYITFYQKGCFLNLSFFMET